MSLIDKLEDLVAKVDTEYREKMEAVILEIVPGCRKGTCAMPPTLLPAIPSSSQGGIPGGTRRSVGSLLRGSRSGIERRSSGRRSGWTGSLVAVLTGG